MEIIKQIKLIDNDNNIYHLSIEKNQDFFIVATNSEKNDSNEIRYFSNINEANNTFNLLKQKLKNNK